MGTDHKRGATPSDRTTDRDGREAYVAPTLTEHPEWQILTGSIGSGLP